MNDFPFDMKDVVFLLGLPQPFGSNSSVNCDCPFCEGHMKMNINFIKNTYRCNKCHEYGGMLKLYGCITNMDTKTAYNDIVTRLSLNTKELVIHKKKKQEVVYEDQYELADINKRHHSYTELLSLLTLAPDHYADLTKRGLTDADIAAGEYKTVPVYGMPQIALTMLEQGCYLDGVPGFYRQDNNDWTVNFYGRGYFIPIRDIYGRIQSLQIRLDNPLVKEGKKPRRFMTFSSVDKKDGTRSINMPHFAGKVVWDTLTGMYIPEIPKNIIITEGPLKADIVYALKGWTTIAVPGVNSIKHLKPLLQLLLPYGLTKLYLAFDMDYKDKDKPEVKQAYEKLYEMLSEIKINYSRMEWDPNYKGIDDFTLFLAQNNM